MSFSATVSISDILTLLTIIAVAITGYVQIRQLYKQTRLTSFSDYTRRYQEILLHLPSNYFSGDFSPAGLSGADLESIRKWIRVYFDLCSEEYFLHKEGYVPDEVWREWKSGIISNVTLNHVHGEWKSMTSRAGFYAEFKSYLEIAVREDEIAREHTNQKRKTNG